MRIRDHLVPIGIAVAALFGAGVAAASTTKKDDKGKGKGGDASSSSSSSKADAGKSATVTRLVKKGGKQEISHTGLANASAWAQDRYQRSVAFLTKLGLSSSDAREMSLSALAHWAIETGAGDVTTAGTHEYNYNVGGIHARDGDSYFESTDAGVKAKFAAYDSADDGVGDYWALLAADYSSCLKQLKDAPSSDAWIRCLGQKGYYGGSVETMASGWKARRDAYATSIHGLEHDELAGDDSSRTFGPYSEDGVNSLLQKARATGMTITGNNPWTLDAGQHGIKLEADFDHDSGKLTLKVLSKNFYVGYGQIWDRIAPLMPSSDRVFGDVDDERE